MKRFMSNDKFDEFKEEFKEKWDKIGTEDLDSFLDIESEEKHVVSKLAQTYNKTVDEMQEEFHEWVDHVAKKKSKRIKDIIEDVDAIENIKNETDEDEDNKK